MVQEDGRSWDRAAWVKGLDRIRDKINERILRRDGLKEYTLDLDSTEIIEKKADALFTYNRNEGYMPMLGFLYGIPVCFLDEFREGSVPPAFGQKEFYLQCKKRIPWVRRPAIIVEVVFPFRRISAIS